jgi:predicted amidohydrolase
MRRNPIRPVSIASICGPDGHASEFLRLAEQAAAQRPDVIVLPENWQATPGEAIDSPVIRHLRALARAHGTYVVHPTYLMDGGALYNTALLIGRDGEICGRYDKIYPYWSELPGPTPGAELQPVIACDFGKVAILICFDANFPDVWASAARKGAELVIWPSAYGAGRQLMAHALNHHFSIVTATLSGHCMAFDIDGERLVNVRGSGHFVQWVTLDLDRCIFHENFNEDKLRALLDERPPRVEVERRWADEQWIVVRSACDQSARDICAQAGMEELRQYKLRSRIQIDELRGGITR